MIGIQHLTMAELEAGLEPVRQAPKQQGVLEMIVRRPEVDQREIVETATLDLAEGLLGDNWKTRGSANMPDGSANPEAQITVMSSRAITLIAQSRERWPLAGDQLILDFDISVTNLPPGARLEIGEALLEVTAKPHTGCKKYVERYGTDAMMFVNSPMGRELCLRGIDTRIVRPGRIRVGDVVRKV